MSENTRTKDHFRILLVQLAEGICIAMLGQIEELIGFHVEQSTVSARWRCFTSFGLMKDPDIFYYTTRVSGQVTVLTYDILR